MKSNDIREPSHKGAILVVRYFQALREKNCRLLTETISQNTKHRCMTTSKMY